MGIKQIFRIAVISALAAFSLLTPLLVAQEESLFEQEHRYDVTLRGNGELYVEARLAFRNTSDQTQSQFDFEIPSAAAHDLVILQQKLPDSCKRYETNSTVRPRPCAEYEEADYFSGYSSSDDDTEYKKATVEQTGEKYKVNLPFEVEADKSSAIIVAYYGEGYVTSLLGRHRFNFETFKVGQKIKTANVSVGADSDLVIKGAKSSVSYQKRSSSGALDSGASAAEINRSVRDIGRYGSITKSTKNLAAGETFNVKGVYASNWFGLYWVEILIALAVVAAIFVAAKLVFKRRGRSLQIQQVAKQPPTRTIEQQTDARTKLGPKWLAIALAAAVSVFALVYLLQYLSSLSSLQNVIEDGLVAAMLAIIMVVLFGFIIFGPAVVAGLKQGWRTGLVVLAFTFLWMVVILVIYVALFRPESGSYNRYRYDENPSPLLDGLDGSSDF